MAGLDAPIPSIHPGAAEIYRRQLEDLQGVLAAATPEERQVIFASVRSLMKKATSFQMKPVPASLFGSKVTFRVYLTFFMANSH